MSKRQLKGARILQLACQGGGLLPCPPVSYVAGPMQAQIRKRFPVEKIVRSLRIIDFTAAQDLTKYHSSIANVALHFPHLERKYQLDT